MSSLRPVDGTASEVVALLRSWDAASGQPPPLVVQTSGSTGAPKRVVLSRSAMRASADATHERLGGPGQWLLALPPTYVAGLQVLFRSVRAGTEPVIAEDLRDAQQSMTGARRYISVVPTQLFRMLEDGPSRDLLSGLDAVLVGGAALSHELQSAADVAGIPLVATYGMAETCGGCVYDGEPLRDVEVRVDQGRIRIRGPVLFDGYDGQPEATAEALRDGWFLTQDLGRIEPDGRLHVTGRTDDVAVSGGVNVPLPLVAERLRAHPDVREAEVVGVPDPEWGEQVVAVVAGSISLKAARDWVAEVHQRSWAPRRIVRVEEIPLLGNGKPDRLALSRLTTDG